MEPITAEVLADERKSDSRGRKIATGERRAELLTAYEASGLTQKAFARREGINFHTLVGWLQRRRAEGGAAPAMRFQEVCLAPGARGEWPLEVLLPDGLMVRGTNATLMAELVRALRA